MLPRRTILGMIVVTMASLAFLGKSPSAEAQGFTSFATIRVKAGSNAGPLMAGARVQVCNSAGRVVATGLTTNKGVFVANQLPEGTYRATASLNRVGVGSATFVIKRGSGAALVNIALR